MRRTAAVATVIGLVIGAAAGPAPTPAVPARADAVRASGWTPAPIPWGKCAGAGLDRRGAECGFLTVPLDYAHPARGTIKIAVSRIRHTVPDAKYQGVMLTNPGGPGGSGLTLSVLGEFVPDGAGNAYDWIGFDPRGVGSSRPKLTCDGTYFGYNRPYYVPITPKLEETWLTRSKGYAKACDIAGGTLLDHVKTVDTIADMESIRTALGAEQINFYGFSYGTYLGQVYGTLHPDRVRRMVLDGNVDVRRVWYKANLDQDVAFHRAVKVFFAWVARHDSVYHLGTTAKEVEAQFYAQQLELLRKPAGGVIGPDEWTEIFLSAGYYVYGWDEVASAFAGWVDDGDWQTLKGLYDGANPQGPGTDNGFAMYLATGCTDVQWPRSWNTWRTDNWVTFAKAPFTTWGNAWFNAPCLTWGAKAGRPVAVNGAKSPPILLIGETLDGATPFEGSLEARSRFPRSVLIEGVGGTTHSGSLSGVDCTDSLIAGYLATGALPDRVRGRRSDVRCEPVPAPVPAALTESARRGADITRADLQKLIGTR
jgi:pimeloyl-ACP methyl ester carboxylesterase